MKKAAPLSSHLVAIKGKRGRRGHCRRGSRNAGQKEETGLSPLNFRVSAGIPPRI